MFICEVRRQTAGLTWHGADGAIDKTMFRAAAHDKRCAAQAFLIQNTM